MTHCNDFAKLFFQSDFSSNDRFCNQGTSHGFFSLRFVLDGMGFPRWQPVPSPLASFTVHQFFLQALFFLQEHCAFHDIGLFISVAPGLVFDSAFILKRAKQLDTMICTLVSR